jgi:hypothetical protein
LKPAALIAVCILLGAGMIALAIRGGVTADAVLTAIITVVCVLLAIFLNPPRAKHRSL